jgi:hypothetical protein
VLTLHGGHGCLSRRALDCSIAAGGPAVVIIWLVDLLVDAPTLPLTLTSSLLNHLPSVLRARVSGHHPALFTQPDILLLPPQPHLEHLAARHGCSGKRQGSRAWIRHAGGRANAAGGTGAGGDLGGVARGEIRDTALSEAGAALQGRGRRLGLLC